MRPTRGSCSNPLHQLNQVGAIPARDLYPRHGEDQKTADLLRLQEVRDSKTGLPTLRIQYPLDDYTTTVTDATAMAAASSSVCFPATATPPTTGRGSR